MAVFNPLCHLIPSMYFLSLFTSSLLNIPFYYSHITVFNEWAPGLDLSMVKSQLYHLPTL